MENNPKEMSPEEKHTCAKDCRDIFHDRLGVAERRTAELADEFTKLEVQIATIIFAFGGLFLDRFLKGLENYSITGIFTMKVVFALIFIFLILSLTLGLIYLKSNEKFWDKFLVQRFNRFAKWEEAVKGTATFEQAEAFQKGSSLGNGANVVQSPSWAWIMQTIFLGFAVILLMILFMVFLFH